QHVPDAPQPAAIALDAGAGPRSAQFPTTEENDVCANCVSTITSNQIIRVDHVTPALAHFFAVFAQNHALVAQLQHGLIAVGDAAIACGFVEEARVNQVHGSVFGAAGISVDWHPIVI